MSLVRKYILLTLLSVSMITSAQVPDTSQLFVQLKIQDSIFFERAFNQCDFSYLEAHIAKDLRFYHDKGGPQDKKVFVENTRKNICGDPGHKPIRKVRTESLRVFPLSNEGQLYGAIQEGVHDFYIREPGKQDTLVGTARFTHVWLKGKNGWTLKEVLSFDHQPAQPATVQSESFEETITHLLQQEKVPALGLGIIRNGVLSSVQVIGNLKEGTPAPYNTLFKIASLTKPIVAYVTLKLVSTGSLNLDEPLATYWTDPDIAQDKRTTKLTPRIVLSHQTGFPNWRYLTDSNKLAFEFEPGTAFQYSGEGLEYLRKALENKFGKTIEVLADSLLFKPAGMTDTHFWWDASVDSTRYACNFDQNGNQLATYRYYEANAAANVLTTVEDYCNFLTLVMRGGGLSETVYAEMTRNQVQLKTNDYFGLGWEKLTNFHNGEYALIHSGKDPGVSTLAVLFPESGNGYVIFLNGDNTTHIFETLLTQYLYSGQELWNKQ